MKSDRPTSLAEIRAQRLHLKAVRDSHRDDLEAHWESLKDKRFRGALLMDAVSDMFHKEDKPGTLGALANGVKLAGGWMPTVASFLGGRKGLLGSKILWSAVGLAYPFLTNKNARAGLGDWWTGVKSVVQKVREFSRGHNGSRNNDE